MKTKKITDLCAEEYVTRRAGEKIREEIIKAVKKKEQLTIDFENLMVASTSFFDEGFAKLGSFGITRHEFDSFVTLENLRKCDLNLLNELWGKRNGEE